MPGGSAAARARCRDIDDLIEDKIAPSNWSAHLGHSFSPLVNASTWALMLTGKVLDDDPRKPASWARRLIKRMGEPVVRAAVGQAMKIMGQQFVLGETIEDGMKKARAQEEKGYTYSYDMLGEAARTRMRMRKAYHESLRQGHRSHCEAGQGIGSMRDNPGISVKLSAPASAL